MFDDVLIESAGTERKAATGITALISAAVHLLIIGAIVTAGLYVKENPEVIEKPMRAFIIASAPPPPPPPPPPAGRDTLQQRAPVETRREQPTEPFTQPRDTPRDVPLFETLSAEESAAPGGMAGGERGGQVGGPFGSTGDDPIPVSGNVRAPVVVSRVDPIYTEVARRARVEGIVIIQAVIDQKGYVTEARVLKPLPFGLDDAALHAVKQWKFRPGTLNGQPVPVYYNLTVHFRIE